MRAALWGCGYVCGCEGACELHYMGLCAGVRVHASCIVGMCAGVRVQASCVCVHMRGAFMVMCVFVYVCVCVYDDDDDDDDDHHHHHHHHHHEDDDEL